MKKHTLVISAVSCLLAVSQAAWAAAFVVRDIEVNGLERVAAGTVLNYLPARVGEQFNDAKSADAIRALFQTGLFDDVQLGRRGDVLVVTVVERPAIGELNIKGNNKIPSEKLMQVLKLRNISKGDTLDKAALATIQRELEEQYQGMGHYGVDIKTTVTPLERNRVAVNININEGNAARIQKVNITGNQAFSDAILLKQLESGPRGAFSIPFLSDSDKYSKEKLMGDLDALNSFYRDRGYINFEITSADVSMSPDKKNIFLNVAVNEGSQYKIGNVSVSGNPGLSKEQLGQSIKLRKGEVFSQKALEETRKNLSNKLGAQGYAFTKVAATPDFDEANKQVGILLSVDQGKRTYVRRIDIRGNNRTKDEVYRRELRQVESSWFSKEQVERSKTRLERLPYVEEATIESEPVAGTEDQIDLIVTVKERSSNQFRVGAGYSQSQGVLFNVNLNQDNFMGTGKQLDMNVDNSDVNKNYSVGYTNPYYTPDGISRGFSGYYKEYDAEAEDIASYASNRYGGSVNYTVPFSEHDSVYASLGAEKRKIVLGTDPAERITSFVDKNGAEYTQLPVTVSYVHDTRNRTIFPTEGQRHRVSLQANVPGSDLQYQKLSYDGSAYKPITDNVTFAVKGKVGTTNTSGGLDGAPFFDKYYAGGIGSVRGFEQNSLGSQDENDDPIGGDLTVTGTAEVQFPMPLAEDVKGLKMSTFVDGGNVFNKNGDFKSDELRYSAGVGAVWLSPLGPFEVSYAKPLNAKDGDKEQQVQFSIGASF
ncbi:outer membrane protein assembly factor BamA [Thiothrix lacustris]|uniref:outer membrane protein assembly factor BamA n=1 Tax=Thiothrix lacustris TaxID=525917 RepID=UPI00048F3F9D|nr:outer membrane protein assembly factor BamA [Thiothrix lacustris]